MVHAGYSCISQTHKVCDTRSEPGCKLQIFFNDNVHIGPLIVAYVPHRCDMETVVGELGVVGRETWEFPVLSAQFFL